MEGQGRSEAPTRPRLSAGARRDQLLDAAAACVVGQGVEALTMEGVAAEAGVSKALTYRHFDNREDLLLALHDREIARLGARITTAIEGTEGFEARLRATMHAWLSGTMEHGRLLGILVHTPLLAGPVEKRRLQIGDALTREWGDLAAAEYGVDRRRAHAAAAVLVAGSEGARLAWQSRRLKRDEVVELFVTMAVAAFEALRATRS
jgi:AcrR family transcriptional regulator